jgi:hypothetical protein
MTVVDDLGLFRSCVTSSVDPAVLASYRFTGAEADAISAQAIAHRIAPLVWEALRVNAEALPVVERLRGYCLTALARQADAGDDLDVVGAALDKAGLRYAVLKGPALARLYPRPQLRSYVDLDLLVDPVDLGSAVQHLESAGLRLLDRNWRLLRERLPGELHLRAPRGTVVDLHWTLTNRAANREGFQIDVPGMLGRAARPPDQLSHPVLDGTDNLLHVALHAALSGGDRIGWFVDVVHSAHAAGDVEDVARRAARWRVSLPVAMMLVRSFTFMATEPPAGLIEALVPHPVGRRLVRAVGQDAAVTADLRARLANVAGRSLRASWPQSAVRLAGRVGRRHNGGAAAPWDDSEVSSIAHPAGENGDLDAFFTVVRGDVPVGG